MSDVAPAGGADAGADAGAVVVLDLPQPTRLAIAKIKKPAPTTRLFAFIPISLGLRFRMAGPAEQLVDRRWLDLPSGGWKHTLHAFEYRAGSIAIELAEGAAIFMRDRNSYELMVRPKIRQSTAMITTNWTRFPPRL